jgi:hypothetical protein
MALSTERFCQLGGDLQRAATRTQLSLIGEDGRRRLTEWRVGLKQEVFGE